MIKIGHWVGQYKFNKAIHQKITGFDSTNFEITITKVDNNNFYGKVQDDLTTGGIEGIGEIQGKTIGDSVEFIKQMPVLTLLVDKNGTRKTFSKKHQKVYYSGTFSDDRKLISGQWKFKFGFIWLGLIPIPIFPTNGTWVLKLTE
jgi:hypothetical protein